MSGLTRRQLLRQAGFAGGVALAAEPFAKTLWRQGYPFSLGVASGEPTSDGMVLWTRLAPDPLEAGGGMPPVNVPVRWEISESADFKSVRSGTAIADAFWGHSVHVEVTGLKPDRPYWYRFIVGGEASATGRTRTAPLAGAKVDRLRLVFASCQNFEAGNYAAHRHIVEEEPDLVLFLGDYIYETNSQNPEVRRHPTPEPTDLAGYRARYATYKLDPALQAAHRCAPWISTWDDHEVADNYGGAYDKHNSDPAIFLRRRAAAYQAFYEHMPLRRHARPTGPNLKLYRTVNWGSLAQFQIIDDRQYRDPPPCQKPDAISLHLDTAQLVQDCAERNDPRRSLLGAAQEQWLWERLAKTSSRWNVLAQQTLMMPYRRSPPGKAEAIPSYYNADGWGGYPATHKRLIRHLRDVRTPNPLILSGDIHAFAAGDHADPDGRGETIASEFVGGSITSRNRDGGINLAPARDPAFRYTDGNMQGYGRLELTAEGCEVVFRGLADVRDPLSAISDIAHFFVGQGKPGIVRT
jgi:alkaline phosphatase D